MKTNNSFLFFFVALSVMIMTSCESFLETLPDQRAEVNSVQKVKDLLISAYPTLTPMIMEEMMSDNRMDNGDKFSFPMNMMIKSYRWQDIGETDWDTPQEVWDACYIAIASANQALEAIEKLGNPPAASPYRGEALMCRAYGHFLLANTFCMSYGDKAAQHLGIPYIKKPETTVDAVYTRGTLEQTYADINQDIEEGLPLISTEAYTIPLYHFNKRAAYAFATRFNVFYRKYEKAIAYGIEALGENPTPFLRNMDGYAQFPSSKEYTLRYINKDDPANLMLLATRSLWGRNYTNQRFGHNRYVCENLTIWSMGPWGRELGVYNKVLGYGDQSIFVPKLDEMFEITNVVAQTGQPHVVAFAFTGDETLLCRAEAYVMTKQYDKAFQDLVYWYRIKMATQVPASKEYVSSFYEQLSPQTNGMPLHPDFALEAGMQTNLLKAVLHARRIETVHEGGRWQDIKRFGIEVTHNLYNEESIILKPQDLRTAIQLPSNVVAAGLDRNPR